MSDHEHLTVGRISYRLNRLFQGEVELGYGSVFTVEDTGLVQGSFTVVHGAIAIVEGAVHGSISVHPGGELRVMPGGQIIGYIRNDGRIENFGTRGGPVHGSGTLTDDEGSNVLVPRIDEDGSQNFTL